MTEVSMVAADPERAETADREAEPQQAAGPSQLTLADEHMLLLSQVAARAEELLTAVAEGLWPGAELVALAGYAQAEVLRQVSDEEALIFPAAPAQQVTVLARDHVRLRSAADMLARAASGEQPMSPGQLAVVVRDFVDQLDRHLRSEEKQLAAGSAARDMPGTAALGGHRHEWYALTKGPVVDLDALLPGETLAAAVDRLLRMRRGERIELRASDDLDPVWREVSRLSPGSYGFVSLENGPQRWRMQITRRSAVG
jgi:uncharacterized protein (DUF2249 family)